MWGMAFAQLQTAHSQTIQENPASLNMDAFGGLGHDDLARGFGAPHMLSQQVIDAHVLQVANTWCRAFFDQRGCASNRVGVVGARFHRVHNHRVRARKVLQMKPHGVLRRLFNERVILGLIRAYINFIVAVEYLGIHCCSVPNINTLQFKSIFVALH